LVVDLRGRFAAARGALTDGIAAVSGRFHGRRPRLATLVAGWRSGPCRARSEFRLRPIRRVAIPDGEYVGAHSGAVAFSSRVEGLMTSSASTASTNSPPM
jgi:hypothetical protein